MRFIITLPLFAALTSATGIGSGTNEDPCHPNLVDCPLDATDCEYNVNIEFLDNPLAYFRFDECGDVQNPVIAMRQDVTYTFKQYDMSNNMHPMGFAYYADGALSNVDELEPGINPPGTSGTCAECADPDAPTCVAPMYFQDLCYQGVFDNISDPDNPTPSEDFGLDLYEPFFFFPASVWFAGGADFIPSNGALLDGGECLVPPSSEDPLSLMKWNVKLRLTWGECFSPDFFYFCHIHKGMSGRVKQYAARTNTLLQENASPPFGDPLLYPEPTNTLVSEQGTQDYDCGTYGLENFFPNQNRGRCQDTYLCTNGIEFGATAENFNNCLKAMNCEMEYKMLITPEPENTIITFIHSMIPHHVNAIQMSKSLLEGGQLNDPAFAVPEGKEPNNEEMTQLAWNIINTQSMQIQTMQAYLDLQDVDEGSARCLAPASSNNNDDDDAFTNQEPFLISIVVLVAAGLVLAAVMFYFTMGGSAAGGAAGGAAGSSAGAKDVAQAA